MASVLTATSFFFSSRIKPYYSPQRSKTVRAVNSFFPHGSSSKKLSRFPCRLVPEAVFVSESPPSTYPATLEEYDSHAELLNEFYKIPSIGEAWIFSANEGESSKLMISLAQTDLLENRKRKLIMSSHIFHKNKQNVSFEWSPFPIEMQAASAVVPSPSGSKLLVVREKDKSTTRLEIWGPSKLEKVVDVPQSVHGPLYADRWFEGISWHHEEILIAYVAEEQPPCKPVFGRFGHEMDGLSGNTCGSWKGEGEWEEDWGETYTRKRKPSLYVLNICSGEVRRVRGIEDTLSVGQVVWAPSPSTGNENYLVFVGWPEVAGQAKVPRRLGMKVCYNRPCSLFAVRSPFWELGADNLQPYGNGVEHCTPAVNLTPSLSSAFFPRFSPDGKFLVFQSAESAVATGAHAVTKSLHRMSWSAHRKPHLLGDITDVVPIVMCPENGSFPGLYCASVLNKPWLSDGRTMILSSAWGSTQTILAIDILRCSVARISPADSTHSWNVLAIDGDNILALSSSPMDPPQIRYGYHIAQKDEEDSWHWLAVSSPLTGNLEKVRTLLSSKILSILKIPVKNQSGILSEGAKKPFESVFISSATDQSGRSCEEHQINGRSNPLIILIHGGPHSVSLTNYSTAAAFFSSLGFDLLMVNYRGSVGFGEEALQSLPGKIGWQDVDDVLTALDYVIAEGLTDSSKVAAYGSSHGGFLTAHLIGQATDRFVVAAVRNPVCNLSLMVGTSDIPDWCYALALGKEGTMLFSDALSSHHQSLFYKMSPIAHVSEVKTPTLFLLGAKDRRVPISNGLQYARALKEQGVGVKVMVFPEDGHVNFRPQSEFESLLNIGAWFTKHFKQKAIM